MFLAADIGNTSIKFGVFEGDEIASTLVIPTERNSTADELEKAVGKPLLENVNAALVSSVVPEINVAIADYLSTSVPDVSFVTVKDDFRLTYSFPIDDAGTDRLVNASAAAELYGVPCVVVAFGTATTIEAVSREREHLGGLIAPGPATTAKALELVASKLPEVRIAEPPGVIATNTEHAIQAGIFYSQIGLVDRAVTDIKQEIGGDAHVVATGGFAPLIADKCRSIEIIEPNLTLLGLKMLYSRR